LKGGAENVLSWALDFGKSVVSNIIEGLTSMLGAIGEKATEIGTTIQTSIQGAVSGITVGGSVAAAIPGGRPGAAPAGTDIAPAVPAGVYDTGGILPSGWAALNHSGQNEYVLPPGQAPITVQVGGIHITAAPGTNGAALAEEVARMLAPRLQAALANMA
jgi:hypothetical protein